MLRTIVTRRGVTPRLLVGASLGFLASGCGGYEDDSPTASETSKSSKPPAATEPSAGGDPNVRVGVRGLVADKRQDFKSETKVSPGDTVQVLVRATGTARDHGRRRLAQVGRGSPCRSA
jgi:hypothetical protein